MLDDFFTYFTMFLGLTALLIFIIFFGKIWSYLEKIMGKIKRRTSGIVSRATTGASDFASYLHIPEMQKFFTILDVFMLLIIFIPFLTIIFMWLGWYPKEDYIALLIEDNLPTVVFIFLLIALIRAVVFMVDYILYEVKG